MDYPYIIFTTGFKEQGSTVNFLQGQSPEGTLFETVTVDALQAWVDQLIHCTEPHIATPNYTQSKMVLKDGSLRQEIDPIIAAFSNKFERPYQILDLFRICLQHSHSDRIELMVVETAPTTYYDGGSGTKYNLFYIQVHRCETSIWEWITSGFDKYLYKISIKQLAGHYDQ